MKISLPKNKKAYFVTDVHLGVPGSASTIEREKELVQWMDDIRKDASDLFLMGDIFDFWFEYKTVVPRGYIRFLGKLAELADQGIRLHWFTGNHDMWMFDYLPKELGLTLYQKPQLFDINGKKLFLAHGDGLGPGDHKYKLLKKCFASPVLQFFFSWIHPDISHGIAHAWSVRSRKSNINKSALFKGEDEALFAFVKEFLQTDPSIDFFVFGHRHHLVNEPIGEKSRIIYVGDWLKQRNYGSFDGSNFRLFSLNE